MLLFDCSILMFPLALRRRYHESHRVISRFHCHHTAVLIKPSRLICTARAGISDVSSNYVLLHSMNRAEGPMHTGPVIRISKCSRRTFRSDLSNSNLQPFNYSTPFDSMHFLLELL